MIFRNTILFLAAAFALTGATMHQDVEYAKRGDVSLTLDASIPDGEGPHPAIVIVHGGGFVRGDKQTYVKPLFPVLTEAGFAWFTINYRLAPGNHFPDPVQDVEDAVRWVRLHSKEYKVDPMRIALTGESAGGHLVSWVGVTSGTKLGLSAVIPFYAPHNLLGRAEKAGSINDNIQAFLGVGPELTPESRAALKNASPYHHTQPIMPPILLIHGTKDTQVDYEQSVEMQVKLRSIGVTCDLFTVKDGQHGMGSWEKLPEGWKAYLVEWLRREMKAKPGTRPYQTGNSH